MRNDIEGVVADIETVDEQIANLKSKRDELEQQFLQLADSDLDALADKDYGCGTVTIETEHYKIPVTVSKTVEWDQNKLATIAKKIAANGEEPEQYMEIKYNIKETAFKNWPNTIQNAFIDARTVTPSKPKMKIQRKEA